MHPKIPKTSGIFTYAASFVDKTPLDPVLTYNRGKWYHMDLPNSYLTCAKVYERLGLIGKLNNDLPARLYDYGLSVGFKLYGTWYEAFVSTDKSLAISQRRSLKKAIEASLRLKYANRLPTPHLGTKTAIAAELRRFRGVSTIWTHYEGVYMPSNLAQQFPVQARAQLSALTMPTIRPAVLPHNLKRHKNLPDRRLEPTFHGLKLDLSHSIKVWLDAHFTFEDFDHEDDSLLGSGFNAF